MTGNKLERRWKEESVVWGETNWKLALTEENGEKKIIQNKGVQDKI